MSDHGTAIQWTHVPGYKGETWNPVTGCDRVSPGCAHCYALELASRLKRMGQYRYQRDGNPRTSGPGFGVTLHSDILGRPQTWQKPRAVFVNSMSDLFHEEIPDRFIAEVFAVMRIAAQHIFMVLTKRPERMRDLLNDPNFAELVASAVGVRGFHDGIPHSQIASENVWLGVTIENRRFVHRADLLRETPAAVRFISAEPLLGPLFDDDWWPDFPQHMLDLRGIDWLITGGESGPRHRRFDPAWAIQLRDACAAAGVAFLHKQNGGPRPDSNGRLLDGRTYDEFPAVAS